MTTPRFRVAEWASSIQIRIGLLAAGAALAYFALVIPLIALSLGPRAAHMASHILLMNALAPVLASAIVASFAHAAVFASAGVLIAATFLQLALLWTWHVPNLWGLTLREPLLHVLVQASLLAASLTFWLAILSEKGVVRWRGVVALLFTGKFSCLLGVLLLFAPRLLYADGRADASHMVADGDEQLADQCLAGLLMLIACPFCYVLAGIAIAA
ncbi:MAG: cytochrome c oxidase assembly protein, partial [Methylocystis sp.]